MVWGSPLKPCTDQTPTETLQSLGLQNRGLQQGTQNTMSASAVEATAVSLCFLEVPADEYSELVDTSLWIPPPVASFAVYVAVTDKTVSAPGLSTSTELALVWHWGPVRKA